METASVVVIGAGVIGLSIAGQLAERGVGRVVVLEKELAAGWGETSRCTGAIRHQFSSAINVLLTRLSLPFFAALEEDTGAPVEFEQNGYLMVTSQAARLAEFKANLELQRRLSVSSHLLSPPQIAELFPLLHTEDLAGGTYCPADGQASPDGVVQGLVRRLVRHRAHLLTSEEVGEIRMLKDKSFVVASKRRRFSTPRLIIAAGPWSAGIGRLMGIELPVSVHPRQVFVIDKLASLNFSIPFVVDLDTGWYLHRTRGGQLVTGGTDKDCQPQWSTAVDWSKLDTLIKAATARLPAMEEAVVTSAYVGLRSVSPDYHAILGEDPATPGLYWAAGFSGHGFMHAPAVGQLLAELVTDGRTSLDLQCLSPERFHKNALSMETCIF
ncbi:MAG: FAD-dependent oxidoreductase [Syntrophomonadaceae bacterium]|mgnify:CR=1 FL=1|nr:FAD-dependent oxidoreductase [Syntrophomonadaceae bacterium]